MNLHRVAAGVYVEGETEYVVYINPDEILNEAGDEVTNESRLAIFNITSETYKEHGFASVLLDTNGEVSNADSNQ